MYSCSIMKRLTLVGPLFLAACSDGTTPTTPTSGSERMSASLAAATQPGVTQIATVDPFTVRAPLDPYRIHQLPDFMIASTARKDLVIQRLVLPTGSLPWHTHPGPSIVIVEQGQIVVTVYDPKTGCVDSPVFGPGDTFYRLEEGVHRPTVVSTEDAVLSVVRFNIPVGGAITNFVADPGC